MVRYLGAAAFPHLCGDMVSVPVVYDCITHPTRCRRRVSMGSSVLLHYDRLCHMDHLCSLRCGSRCQFLYHRRRVKHRSQTGVHLQETCQVIPRSRWRMTACAAAHAGHCIGCRTAAAPPLRGIPRLATSASSNTRRPIANTRMRKPAAAHGMLQLIGTP